MQGKNAFFVSKNVLYLPFGLVRKEKKIKFDLPKTTEQFSTLGDYLILEMRIQILKIQLMTL